MNLYSVYIFSASSQLTPLAYRIPVVCLQLIDYYLLLFYRRPHRYCDNICFRTTRVCVHCEKAIEIWCEGVKSTMHDSVSSTSSSLSSHLRRRTQWEYFCAREKSKHTDLVQNVGVLVTVCYSINSDDKQRKRKKKVNVNPHMNGINRVNKNISTKKI